MVSFWGPKKVGPRPDWFNSKFPTPILSYGRPSPRRGFDPLPATKLSPTKSHDLLELDSGNTFPTLKQQQRQWGNPLKYSGHALDIASFSIIAREDDMFKLSVMDNIEINCQVPTLNMPVTTFHDLRNCSSPDSQYKSLEKKRKIKTPSLDKDSKMEWKACVS